MPELLSVLACILFIHLLIGGLVFMVSDPGFYLSAACSAYAQKEGRLPNSGEIIMACASVILLWPWIVKQWARALGLTR